MARFERLERFFARIGTYAVFLDYAFRFVAFISSGGLIASAYLLYRAIKYKSLFAAILTIAITVFSSAILYTARLLLTKRKTQGAINPFVVEENRVVTFHVGKNLSRQQLELELRALQDHVYHIWVQYHWTGSGPVKMTCTEPGCHVTGPFSFAGSVRQHFLIVLGTPLLKKTTRKLKFTYELHDPELRAQPFVGTWGVPERRKFEIRVVFPENHPLPAVYFMTYQVATNTLVEEPILFSFPEDSRTAIWKIDKPKVGWNYVVSWPAEYVRALPGGKG